MTALRIQSATNLSCKKHIDFAFIWPNTQKYNVPTYIDVICSFSHFFYYKYAIYYR